MADSEGKYSMPIKQAYKAHIKESREHETHALLYEFMDDHKYSDAEFVCVHIRKNPKGEILLYLSMEKGPQDLDSMTKILQWRISGNSNEKGHKGGGNKRLLYGHYASRIVLNSMVNDEEFIRAETKPDDIFMLSNDPTISEGDFQNRVDRDYIKWPTDYLNLEEEGAWFNSYQQEMQSRGLHVKYVTRMSLTEPIRKEYIDKKQWRYLISLIQMKNYNIPIYFKNEILDEQEFTRYPNIDMIGLYHKEMEQMMHLYLMPNEEYIIKNKNTYFNTKGEEIAFDTCFKLVANLHLYKINEQYLKEQLNALNAISKPDRKYNQEDFYGIYIVLNGKQTNYLSIIDILPLSKNLGPELGNSCFRFIIEPVCDDNILEKIIVTDTLKAKTGFKFINKAKKLGYEVIKQTKNNICPEKNEPIKKKSKETIYGQCYIIQLGPNLYKYGYVTTIDNIESRMKSHKKESIEKVKEFCEITMPQPFCKPLYYTIPIEQPKAFEEWIGQLLDRHCVQSNVQKITLYQSKGSEHEQREYFTCNDPCYIHSVILPLILEYQLNI